MTMSTIVSYQTECGSKGGQKIDRNGHFFSLAHITQKPFPQSSNFITRAVVNLDVGLGMDGKEWEEMASHDE